MKDYFQFLESGVFVGVVCVCVYPIMCFFLKYPKVLVSVKVRPSTVGVLFNPCVDQTLLPSCRKPHANQENTSLPVKSFVFGFIFVLYIHGHLYKI